MSKKRMLVSFVLDETGSMGSVKGQTISGFNEYVGALRSSKKADRVRFTLTKFNSAKTEIVHDGAKLGSVKDLTNETYRPDMATPLYDAIGATIRAAEKKARDEDSVLIVIQTDGQENASQEYLRQNIFDLIEEKKLSGWSFVFLGADQDAYAASASLGISAGSTMSYASANTQSTFRGVGAVTVSYLDTGAKSTDAFFDTDNA